MRLASLGTGCTASIGVGNNKLLAKLTTDKIKPDNFEICSNPDFLLSKLKLSDLKGIGRKKVSERSERALRKTRVRATKLTFVLLHCSAQAAKLNEIGLDTVEDVWDADHSIGVDLGLVQLKECLGKVDGKKIYEMCYGRDASKVEQKVRKSIGAKCSYGVRFDDGHWDHGETKGGGNARTDNLH